MLSHRCFHLRRCWPLAALIAAGCGAAPTPAPPAERPLVAVSLPPLGWLAQQVGGDDVRVEVVIPPNRDPHSYEPSPREVSRLADAALFFRVGHPGLPFEARVTEILATQRRELRVLSLSEVAAGQEPPLPAGDPHLWLAPSLLTAAAHQLAAMLGELVPGERARLAVSAESFAERMAALDRELRTTLERGGCRSFLVDHPAWGAFALSYGLSQLAIENAGKEPGPATLARLLERARAARIRRVLIEPGMPLQSSRTVARELSAEVVMLDPLTADVSANLRLAAELIAGGCRHE